MTNSLDHYRRQAKSLKKAFAAAEPQALRRAQAVLGQVDRLTHTGALHVLACEAGFESWPRLKFHTETAAMGRAAQAEQLQQALFQGIHWRVEQLLAATPDLADDNFGLLCALYRADAVRTWLQRDPEIALRAQLGPRRPILHLAFSRHFQAHPWLEPDMLSVARLLRAAGADVDDGFPAEPGSPHLLSALYGAIGHAGNMVLGQWLLDNGANPDDGETLYHATELGHHDGLRMMLAAGANPRGTNALLRAMDFDDPKAVKLLLDHGADANEYDDSPVDGEAPWVMPALHQAARRLCSGDIVTLLLQHGADPTRIHAGCTAYGFARVYGNTTLARAIEATGKAPPLSRAETLLAQAADDTLPAGAQLDPADLPVEYRTLIRAILHLPGKLPHVQRLVALGLDPETRDREGLTALHVAGWEGLPEMLTYLLSLDPDLHHVNGYGGNLITTILHGSENNPARRSRDHARCLQLALEQGLPLGRNVLTETANPALLEVMQDWVAANPDRLVDVIP